MVRYLTKEDILLIHSILIDETGGAHGVRDRHTISSLIELPKQSAFGKELYPTVFEKAAVYARNVILNHPFIDGNKRTGVTAASVFLDDNGYYLVAEKGKVERLALRIVKEKLGIKAITAWLKKNSKKIT